MGRAHPLRDAGLALSLMTLVPTPARWPEGERTDVAGWLPLAGALLGGIAWAGVHGLRWLGWDGNAVLVVAAIVVVTWALLTRLLHWDGLADLADGIWGGHTPQRRLEIMADSQTGAFGATAVALVAVVEVTAIASIIANHHERPLLIVPILARLAATFAAWLGKPARPGGLGASVMGTPHIAGVLPAALMVAVVGLAMWAGYGQLGALFVVAAVIVAAAVPHVLSGPIGGVTGDLMGASVLITEALLFATTALIWGA